MLTREQSTLKAIPFLRRFHIRLTLWYGGAVLLVLSIMGVLVYRLGLDSELGGLRDRILAMAVTLSNTLDTDALAQVSTPEDVSHPAYGQAMQQFQRLSEGHPGIEAIYVMRPTERPDQLFVVVDYDRRSVDQARPGETYDARQIPVMLRGLREPAVEEEPVRDEYGLTLSGYAPLHTSDGAAFGLVGLDISAERVAAITREVQLISLALFGLAAVLLVGLAVAVARSIRRPLSQMMHASSEIAAGNFDARVDLVRGDEFAMLGENFNQMASGLRERDFIRDTLGRYVSRDVARAVLATPGMVELGGEERDVTVLLSDIRGYSTMSELLAPQQVVEFLNQYFGAMNEVIDAHKGCVIEYLGDGILVVFGAPNPVPSHPGQAVQCALAMRQRLAELHVEWESNGLAQIWRGRGLDSLAVRVGIHSGPVVAGNLGSKSRMKYSVTGDTVNLAARLEQLNKVTETGILFSAATFERLPEALRAAAVDRGAHQVKGRTTEVHVYSI